MAFIGSVPKEARVVITEILKTVPDSKPLYVGCSGNFVIDRIGVKLGREVHSNDVSLYSKVIADIARGVDTNLEVKDDKYREIFDSWKPHKYKTLVMVMYIMKASEYEDCKNDFKRNSYKNLINYNKDFYNNTIEKLERNGSLDFEIKDFFFGDFREHLNSNTSGVSLLFAPTYTGGYEKMYTRVEEVFEYERAKYDMFDTHMAENIYKNLLSTQETIIYSDQFFESMEEYMVSKIIMPQGKRDIYIYTSVNTFNSKILIDTNTPKVLRKTYKLLPKDFEFTESTKITIIESPLEIVNHYKHLYMGAKVDYSEGGDFGVLLFADGLLFGFASYSKFLGTKNKRHIFLQSDFCVNHFSKLSKLVIKLLLAEKVRDILITKFAYYYEGVQTSVYTDKPVSMKYRGAFKLIERNEKEKKLTYVGEFKNESEQEIYNQWYRKIYTK